MTLSHKAIDNLRDNIGYGGVSVIEDFVAFVDEFGHDSKAEGTNCTVVEVGASYLIRTVKSKDEANVGRWIPPNTEGRRPKYSPVYERHRLSFDVFAVANKDIPKGTKLLKYEEEGRKEGNFPAAVPVQPASPRLLWTSTGVMGQCTSPYRKTNVAGATDESSWEELIVPTLKHRSYQNVDMGRQRSNRPLAGLKGPASVDTDAWKPLAGELHLNLPRSLLR